MLLVFLFSGMLLPAAEFGPRYREFGHKRADLKPLMAWWNTCEAIVISNRALPPKKQFAFPPRPMPAWIHIKGEVIESGPYRWKVRAAIAATPGDYDFQTIIVRSPPEALRQEFVAARAAAKAARERSSGLYSASQANRESAAENSARANTFSMINAAVGGRDKDFERAAMDYGSRASAQRHAADSQSSEAARQKEIAFAMEKRALQISPHDEFVLDLFALRTGELLNGLPVFEIGHISPYPNRRGN